MAGTSFKLDILTPKKKVFSGEVSSLVAPGELGYLGVLANHAPLVTTLVPGKVTFRDPSGATRVMESVGDGLLEVHHNQVTLLVDGIAS